MDSGMNVLAVDIGASSGRVIKITLQNNKILLNEIHRFKNEIVMRNNDKYWDHQYIFKEIIDGISKCDDYVSVGIDTWGLDYVLIDNYTPRYGYSYRSNRSYSAINNYDLKELFKRTGLVTLPFNTLLQLEVEKMSGKFLMVSDYYVYLLTNRAFNEYTNMKTTQLLNLDNQVKYYQNIEFMTIASLNKIKYKDNKFVTLVASHDTASAFIGSYGFNEGIVISLGTWSVVGSVEESVLINDKVFSKGFSNEGCLFGKSRLVKNTMGSWMIENLFKEMQFNYDYDRLIVELDNIDLDIIIDVDNIKFIAPNSMKTAIDEYLLEHNYKKLNNIYEYAKVIYDSMLLAHLKIINELMSLTNKKYSFINIVGGGAKNSYFSSKLKLLTNMDVYVGPYEATAIGNAFAQFVAFEKLDVENFQEILINSNLVEVEK